MIKISGSEKINFNFYQFSLIVMATILSFGSTLAHEVKSSYYLISTRATERCELTQVNGQLNEKGCLSLCNRDDTCADVVYNNRQKNAGSCLASLNRKRRKTDKAVKISKGENILLFKKLGREFDFKGRKFQGVSFGKGCGFHEEDLATATPKSCKEIYDANRSAASGVYSVWPNGNNDQKERAYCHMTNIPGCGEGGWTLVMKIDGDKAIFHYNSRKWTNKESYYPATTPTGLDLTEMLSPAYWTTPLTKLCLGMKKQNEMNWILVPVTPAQSLYNLIAANKFTNTHLGRRTWKSLLRNSYLQNGCDKEGFNAFINDQKVRIGMVAGMSCIASGSSLIGVGTTTRISSGNYNGSRLGRMPSFGYILVQ